MTDYSISIRLDKRRTKASGKYPVRLRVFTPIPRKQKLIPLPYEFTEKEFDSIWNSLRVKSEYKEFRRELTAIELRANEIAKSLSPFTHEEFERKMFRRVGDGIRVACHYKQKIAALYQRNQVGTASNYELSQKSIDNYVIGKLQKSYDNLTLLDITPDWLHGYEDYMVDELERSTSTVSMYLRALKTLFNDAIAAGEVEQKHYPFGKRKYQPPAKTKVKKALNSEQLAVLFNAVPDTEEQEKAKDFWFFSYACNGMNVKDIANIRIKDVDGDKLTFYREKTKRTSKERKQILVYLNSFTESVIEKYGNLSGTSNDFVFDIISTDSSAKEQHLKINNFNRFIGQHIKKLCKLVGLPEISPSWARHSFATNAIRKGATMEFIQEGLGHENIKTTQNYFAGFDNDTKKAFADTIMDFS